MRAMVRDWESWSRGEVFAAFVLAAAFLSVIIPAAIEISHNPVATLQFSDLDGKV
ncbi:MAG TPA: hypothetical protein VGL83_19695 [Stellaceae bacterium]|jgi:hypothetical protein